MCTLKKYGLEDYRVQRIINKDERLGRLINFIESSEIKIEKDGFQCLVKYIIGQQISDKARETIWNRLYEYLDSPTPEKIIKTSDSELRELGLSFKKIEYINILATSVFNKELNFDELKYLSNAEIISKLTSLKGIGTWTAEMYLIFSLGRDNVFPKSDGTIKRVMQWSYDLEEAPSSKFMSDCFLGIEDYATLVCSFFWRAIDLNLTKKSFDEIIP